MLKTAKLCLVFTALLCQPVLAQQFNNYLGFGIRNFTTDNSEPEFNGGDDLEASGFQIALGQELSPSLAVEVNFSRDEYDPISYETDELARRDIDIDFDYETETIGISFIFSIDTKTQVTPYFRFSWATRDAKGNLNYSDGQENGTISIDDFESDSGEWYGIGAKIRGSETFGLNIELARFGENSTGIMIGPQFYF